MVAHPDTEHPAVVPELHGLRGWRSLEHMPMFAKELIAGGVAGGMGKTCVAPLERVKILFQTGRMTGKGVGQTLKEIYHREGPAGLFKGNGASVLRIVPYAALHFTAYERYRRALLHSVGMDPDDPHKQAAPALDLLAGSAAGATAVVVTYPLDLVRTRLAYASDSSGPAQHPSPTKTGLLAHGAASGGGCSVRPIRSGSGSFSGGHGIGRPQPRVAAVTMSHLGSYVSSVHAEHPAHQRKRHVGSGAVGSGGGRYYSSPATSAAFRGGDGGASTTGKLELGSAVGYQGSSSSSSNNSTSSSIMKRNVHASTVLGPSHQEGTAARMTIRTVTTGILRTEGVVGLYRGIGPTLVGILPYAGLKFYVYQSSKKYWREATGAEGGQRLPVPLMLTFGALSGLVAQTATYPLDVVRRRMQVQALQQQGESKVHLRHTWHALQTVVAAGGWRALYAGLSINYMKVVPSTAIGFTLYDSLKQLLGITSSI
mmetsp:Transcript_3670/g.10620  ORF Transcript_3670/g.10620 Transcript_3670/m.10620 type:complete len:484 (+) Transcript_3670:311-1762(+)|eukprot:CAMPEP_0206138704 /NCGR_PEP_ID=MMETSP1473-20131121/3504_1 /ASSEMBLY_ACC=CAM_ASM_001109 /TAXON_ID=1461547 /ORGANISM="Stichococcus sp, Strain RCC1054" /LENGTH=483 /DNA_ID=CAMNT_0053532207 /DNA_START=243 /DNA_END=1694 /DNA_ORIENTATION=+